MNLKYSLYIKKKTVNTILWQYRKYSCPTYRYFKTDVVLKRSKILYF